MLSPDARADFERAARRKPRTTERDRIGSSANLPLPAMAFIGRERELDQIRELLEQYGIVIIVRT
jgi:hypothetical protein